MNLISETRKIKYYDGVDFEKIHNHPRDGSEGMIICFVGDWETEVNIFKRDMRIGSILGECDYELDLCKIDSNCVAIYQVGNIDVYDVYEIVKNKIEINHSGVDFYLPISGKNW